MDFLHEILSFQKAETLKEEVVSHWHPNLTISLVTDQTNWAQGAVPPPLNECMFLCS